MDELERELRRVLHDERLRVEPGPDALDRVHRGAERRRRRRRAAAGGLSAFSVVAVATLALATPMLNQQQDSDENTSAGSARPEKADQSTAAGPSPLETGRRASPNPQRQTQTGGPVPDGFAATSVTAMSPSSFWVLGTAPCDNAICTSVVRTSDGGKTFRGLPAPKAELGRERLTTGTVTDLRFATANDGFAYGGALWSTHDGGTKWTAQRMPGRVVRLEADRGTAWAIVQTGDRYRLYRSPAAADSWRQVSLPERLDTVTPDLALQSGAVTITGTSGERAVSVVSRNDGDSFTARDRPCAADLDSRLSAFGDTLWMFCATGTQGRPYVSSTSGRSWQPVDAVPAGGWPNSAVVGARGAKSAVVGAGSELYRVSTGGAVRQAGSGADGAVKYVGFTTANVGYAVFADPDPAALLRTTDGGRSWSVVRYS